MRDTSKFVSAALLVLVALLLTFKLKAALGWSPDVLLPILAVAGFFLDIYALAFLVLLTVWVLNWQTGLPVEMLVLAAAPCAAWLGKRFLPAVPWLTLAAVILAGEVALYALGDASILLGNLGFIISNVVFALLFGLSLMALLEWAYEK
ncbi:MAG: hypothetical protein A2855_00045 [Candidatus Liptonbacteria bacterium RIFCSPHIGHO2_01_FULL_57_28]|uniref:Rod shape-determining protein MreD n=1 Tax=Candidatus Liptonbacteria bacterium RIFCSPHIGHO2_01_FULL_57_28 TaxID=1798647 RepID=A0A1G2CAL9_9BACT|nr:MAG: hypothetical protein A2855_00045 [Candidatus Liptonbacteria bacterium RIFCSPHIGHO2_01_FULL_57_28]